MQRDKEENNKIIQTFTIIIKRVIYLLDRQVLFGRDVKMFKDRPANIYEMLSQSIKAFPDREAIVMEEFRQTYSQLGDVVDGLAVHFYQKYKIRKGDRVALLLNNCPEFIHVVLACARLGAIVVPLNTRLSHLELSYMISHSGSSLIFTEEEKRDVIEKVNEELALSHPYEVVFVTNHKGQKGNTFLEFIHLKQEISLYAREEINETDPLFIMFTSGTTGTPKGALGSHVGIISSALNYKHVIKASESVRTLIAVPLFHVTGLIGQLFYMIAIGGTSVLLERYQTEPFIRTIVKENITFLFNVPTIYVMVMSHPLFQELSVSSVKVIAYGGAPMSYETIEQLRKHFPGIQLHNAYGATETSSPTTIMPVHYDDDKLNSVGKPVPVAEIKVINEAGEELSAGEVGELLIKGPMVIEGYWRNEEANAKSFEDDYWKSGDMAKVDCDGFVYIMDRKKDMINRGGEKIFSVEVENVLYGHEGVLEAAVVGVPDALFGEQVKAYIVKKENVNINENDIQEFLKSRLADYKIPKFVEFIKELPRNPGGKILKSYLAKLNQNKSRQ